MSQQRYAVGKYAWGICDQCGAQTKYLRLRMEPLSAYGAPSNAPSNILACPDCYDPPHPQSFLPQAIQAWGADAEALRNPRPDDPQGKTFAVKFSYIGQLYLNSSSPLPIPLAYSGLIRASGTFAEPGVVVDPPTGITIYSIAIPDPSVIILDLFVDPSMDPGVYTINITDADNCTTSGQVLLY